MSHNPSKILIAEDNYIVALDIEQTVSKLGYDVIGPCRSVSATLEAVEKEIPDFAFLDVELTDGRSFRIASKLKEHAVPFVFITARTDLVQEAGYSSDQVVVKPFKRKNLEDVIKQHIKE